MIASRSAAKSGKSRWQWLSTSTALPSSLLTGARFDEARKDTLRLGQWGSRHQRGCVERDKLAGSSRYRKLVQEFAGGSRDKGLRQDPEMPDHFSESIKHGPHPRFIGPPQGP